VISLIPTLTTENSELTSKASHIDTIINKPELCILGPFPPNTGIKRNQTHYMNIHPKINNFECNMQNETE